MNFCSECGAPEPDFRIPEGDTFPRYICRNCQTIFYTNPRIISGCVPIFEDKILLCRRSIEPRSGLWNLPAGFLENGETVEQGALRELEEEAGVSGEILRLHTIYNLPDFQQVYLLFLTQLENPSFPTHTTESSEIKLFPFSEIPWNAIAFSSTEFALKSFLQYPDFLGVHTGIFQTSH